MTLNSFMNENGIVWEYPYPCILTILTKGKEAIYWVDPDGFRKTSYFIKVDANENIIEKISFKDFNNNIEYLFENGWINTGFFENLKEWG